MTKLCFSYPMHRGDLYCSLISYQSCFSYKHDNNFGNTVPAQSQNTYQTNSTSSPKMQRQEVLGSVNSHISFQRSKGHPCFYYQMPPRAFERMIVECVIMRPTKNPTAIWGKRISQYKFSKIEQIHIEQVKQITFEFTCFMLRLWKTNT